MAGQTRQIDEQLLAAWDKVHIHDLDGRSFEIYGPEYQVSFAEAETLLDVYRTTAAAARRFPHIPAEIIERAMRNARELRDADRTGDIAAD